MKALGRLCQHWVFHRDFVVVVVDDGRHQEDSVSVCVSVCTCVCIHIHTTCEKKQDVHRQ